VDSGPTRLTRSARALASVLSLLIALAVLNASLTFENVWPTPRITWGHTISVELALALVALGVSGRWRVPLARRAIPAAWVYLVVGRYADVTGPGLYGREFNLYWDSRYLGDVVAMLGHGIPWWMAIAGMTAALLLLVATFVLARFTFGHVAAGMDSVPVRRGLTGLGVAAVATFAVAGVGAAEPTHRVFAAPVTPAYVRQARFVTAMLGPNAVGPDLAPSPAFRSTLAALGDRDVIVVFAESYGAVAWDTPAVARALASSQRELANAARDTDRHIVSAFVESPTFGGSSWLAHLTLLSGVEVRDQYAYTALMATRRDTLVRFFRRQGYRTVALMPGMRQAWPEGAFYGFDTIYGRDALDYRGPQFGWWSIPDQYALARFDVLERTAQGRQPVFAVFPTSTTHAPFGPVAPYQPDWSRILEPEPFDRAEVARAMAVVPDLTNLRPGYIRATAYDYTVFAGWLRHRLEDAVVVIVGDHQPAAAVTGPGAPWSVPVHVITRDAPLLERLRAHGFTEGLTPHQPALGHMAALVPILLDAFSATPDLRASPTATH
jgi:hypothetical protein